MLRGAGLYGADVTIVRPNIRAGCSVIHFVDAAVFDDDQRKFWCVAITGAQVSADRVLHT